MAEDEAQAEAREAKSAARIARDAAVEQSVGTLAYIAITVAVSVAVLKRDALWRLWRRITTRPVPPAEVEASAAVADLRRDISRYEHATEARPPGPRGLYERW
jgi:hypothetical protein